MKIHPRHFLTLFGLFLVFSTMEAVAQEKALVRFTEKADTGFDPHAYFDAKAIARRVKHNLPLNDVSDWPVTEHYVAAVQQRVDTITVVTRWLNGVVVRASSNQLEAVKQLPFVKSVELLMPMQGGITRDSIPLDTAQGLWWRTLRQDQLAAFGDSLFQQANITGKGVRVAVFDAGFNRANYHPAFQHIRDRNGIIKAWDFRKNDDFPYRSSSHGTMVLSNIGGSVAGVQLGLAVDAEFLLARTEVVMMEKLREQEYWLAAAEWADKHGADIINSSLGYTVHNFFKREMDGKTALITRAATIAAHKGILVVNSAGNEGSDRWHIIGAPADADSVLAVGGISPWSGYHSGFSSYGPTADKRMKPNVAAFGTAAVAGINGLSTSSGTSFSSPLVAGFAACALQAQPQLTNMDLFHALEKSGNMYPYFDYAHGYGIPQAAYFTNQVGMPDTTFDFVEDRFAISVLLRPKWAELKGDTAIAEDSYEDEKWEEEEAQNPMNSGALSLEFYYHLQNPNGVLDKYAVLSVRQRNIFQLRKLNYAPGTVLRVYYRGFTAKYVFE